MKIAFICNEYPPKQMGGIGAFVSTMASSLNALGHTVTVVELGTADFERFERGIRIVSVKCWHNWGVGGLRNRLAIRNWLRRAVARGEVDLIEVPDCEGLLPFANIGCPVVVRLHQSATAIARAAGRRPGQGTTRYERRTLLMHRNWIAVSRTVQEATQRTFGLEPRLARIIHNPVSPTPSSRGANPAAPRKFVMHAGAVTKQKGAELAAQAGRVFLGESPDLDLIFVGAVPGGRSTMDRIREIVGDERAARVHFVGYVKRSAVFEYMRGASALIFPSEFEAFPYVVAEALSVGTPVIVPREGPFTEFLTHEQTALLVTPGDASALSRAVLRVLGDPDLAASLSAKGQELAERLLNPASCARASLAFYEEVLAASASGPMPPDQRPYTTTQAHTA